MLNEEAGAARGCWGAAFLGGSILANRNRLSSNINPKPERAKICFKVMITGC
jgi:hypothetical protein